MTKTTIPWSYSQLSTYESCPLKYEFAYIDRVPAGVGAITIYRDRGIAIHKKAEDFVKHLRARKAPEELKKLESRYNEAKRFKAIAEAALYLDKQWVPTEKGGHWGVVKADVHWVVDHTLVIVDLKTGRPRDYSDQGRIYVAGFWALYADLKRAYAECWFSQTGTVMPYRRVTYNFAQVKGIRKEIEQRVMKMQEGKYPPKPGAACTYCDFSKHKGGPCTYG